MNSRLRPPLYISLKSWLCCCSLPTVVPQQLHQTYISLTDVLTCLLNLILFAISIHTTKISRQSFRYVAFRDEQTVHLTLFLKKGKCMVFKPRQVQDARIVKFKEIFIQHHDCSSIKETIFVGVILDENCGIPTTRTSFGGFLCRHLTTNVVILERDGDRRNTYVLNVYNTFSQISLLSRSHD